MQPDNMLFALVTTEEQPAQDPVPWWPILVGIAAGTLSNLVSAIDSYLQGHLSGCEVGIVVHRAVRMVFCIPKQSQ